MHSTETQKQRVVYLLLFVLLCCILLFDRAVTLFHFGFVYTDIDQLVLWNGAVDYSQGIFHEPFFYGQSYNYMLESLLAVPLIQMGIPVYKALPVITTVIALFPFVVLALLLFNKKNYFWSYFCLVLPVLLPVQYNFLTTISRGFVQAFVFIPLLFIPLIEPQTKRSSVLIYIASALCIVANQSAVLIVLPIFLLVYAHQWRSKVFYLKSLLVIPFFAVDYLAHYFYKLHPERVLHGLSGIRILGDTFLASMKNMHHFENLFPFVSGWGILYPVVFIFLAIIAWRKSFKRLFVIIISVLFFLLLTMAVPKVQETYPLEAGIFFTPSRLYIYLPLILLVFLYLLFKYSIRSKFLIACLIVVSGITTCIKYLHIGQTVSTIIKETDFPVAKNADLIEHANKLRQIASRYAVKCIIQPTDEGWNPIFDSYAFYPLTYREPGCRGIISFSIKGDRRVWLYSDADQHKQILLNGVKAEESLLKQFDCEQIESGRVLIKNNRLTGAEILQKLNLQFGNVN